MKELMARKNQCEKDILALGKNLEEINKEIEEKEELDWKSLPGGTVVGFDSGVRALVCNNGFNNKMLIALTGYDNCYYPAFMLERISSWGKVVKNFGSITEYIRNLQ
jgi:hypothetical protein